MKCKNLFAPVLLIIFGVLPAVQAQTVKTDDSIKELRKALVKNSRYQFQEITLQFTAKDFRSCEVSYGFERAGSLGDENFGQATVERSSPASPTVNSTSTTRTVYSPVTGNTAGQISDRNPNFLLRESTFFNTNAITSFNLSNLNPESIEIKSAPNGIFLVVKTLDGKSSIQKNPNGNGSSPVKTSFDFLPIASEKKAEKVRELLARAIRQCSEQK
jgi:hypothetical protein